MISIFESGPASLRVGDREAVHSQIASIEQPRHFEDGGALQPKAHVELVFAIRTRAQQAARAELAKAQRSAIGARRRAGKADHHVAALVRIDVHVGAADVEHRLGVAELEVQAAIADLNVGNACAGAGSWTGGARSSNG